MFPDFFWNLLLKWEFWNLLFGHHAGNLSFKWHAECVSWLWFDCAPNPQTISRFSTAKEPVHKRASKLSLDWSWGTSGITCKGCGRGRWVGGVHFAAMTTIPNKPTRLVNRTGYRKRAERNVFKINFFVGETPPPPPPRVKLTVHGRSKRSTTNWTQLNILTSTLLLTKLRLSSYMLKNNNKNNEVLTLSISVLCIEAECPMVKCVL